MDIVVIGSLIGFLVVVVGTFLFLKRKRVLPTGLEQAPATSEIVETSEVVKPEIPVTLGLEQKLQKTRGSIFGRLSQFLNRHSTDGLSKTEWDEIEEILLEADIGFVTSQTLLTSARSKLTENTDLKLRDALVDVSLGVFSGLQKGAVEIPAGVKPWVVSVVGINGAGKTTTVGKLAHQLMGSGKTVLLGAVDTFRAGAISQLKVWAERTGAQFVTGREGADPGAVAFDSVTAAKARGVDVVLLDTAGRLHTKANLMEELKKIHRVIKKIIPEAPHETWLVIDGTLGQNSVAQAKEFQKSLDLTGIIVTKLDGTAKGGAILSIASELKLPIRYVGVGEGVEDLTPFEPKAFVDAILG